MQKLILFVLITIPGAWAAAIDCMAVDSYVFSSSDSDLPWKAMTVSQDVPGGAFKATHSTPECSFTITSMYGKTYSVNISDTVDSQSLTSNAGFDVDGKLYMAFVQSSGKVCALRCSK